MNRTPLIIDVDTGIDDAIALALAVAQQANIVGVTSVAGNVPINVATRNTLDVLAFLGRLDIPVHRGASRPLAAEYQDATHVHGGNGLGGVDLPASGAAEAGLAGPAFIIKTAADHAGALTLVTLGPLTNLAIALNVRPQITHQISRVVVMGGAYFVSGNVTPKSEFNVYVDPEAAHQVFGADWNDLTLVGLDVTHQTVLSRSLWDQIPEGEPGLPGFIRELMERTFTERRMSGFYLHDPLAVAVALDPELVDGFLHSVTVDTSSNPEVRGKTTAIASDKGPMVAVSVQAQRFVDELSEVLGLPRADPEAGFERAE
ncbi:MAG: nucleoside hydrolase [Chloroflexia bacterium]|nr:nucleoside hydrolase [Chloroflexia bacterium]